MATDPFEEDMQLAIKMSLETFQLESPANPGGFSEEPAVGTQEVLPSPSIALVFDFLREFSSFPKCLSN